MAPPKKFNITKSELIALHRDQHLTPNEIAEKFGCSHSLILHYLKKFGITKLPKYERLEGARFGRLRVVRLVGFTPARDAVWECACDCGAIAHATTARLRIRDVQSCGCLNVDSNVTHGMTRSRPYRIWQGMKTRCENPNVINFERYGRRGIGFVEKWRTFEGFWEDMADGYADDLSIERVDNDRGYSKKNCIWADARTQSLNKSSNVYLTHDGRTQTVTEWAAELNVTRDTLYRYHVVGLPDREIFKKVLK